MHTVEEIAKRVGFVKSPDGDFLPLVSPCGSAPVVPNAPRIRAGGGVILDSLGNISNNYTGFDFTGSGKLVFHQLQARLSPAEYLATCDGFRSSQRGQCPNSQGSATFIFEHLLPNGVKLFSAARVNLTCKQWRCPVCQKRLLSQLVERLNTGCLFSEARRLSLEGYDHFLKGLTLTAPGAAWRAATPPEQAHRIMQKNLNRLLTALRKQYGSFHYFWTVEPQKNGYPHFHLILLGVSIIPYSVLAFIRRLWHGKYGMGSQMHIKSNPVSMGADPAGALNYALKYLRKSMQGITERKNHYGYSRGVLGSLVGKLPGRVVKINTSGQRIQDSHPVYRGDFVSLVPPEAECRNLWVLVDALVQAGHWDRFGKVTNVSSSRVSRPHLTDEQRKAVDDLKSYYQARGVRFYRPDEDE